MIKKLSKVVLFIKKYRKGSKIKNEGTIKFKINLIGNRSIKSILKYLDTKNNIAIILPIWQITEIAVMAIADLMVYTDNASKAIKTKAPYKCTL